MRELLTIFELLSPMALGAIIIQFFSIPIRRFQAVFLLLSALWVGAHVFFFPHVSIIAVVATILAAEVALFLAMGFLGTRLGAANYESVLVAVGFFPWYLGLTVSAFYLMLVLFVLSVVALVKYKLAARTYGLHTLKPAEAKKRLSTEDFKDFIHRASMIFAMPVLFSAFFVLGVTNLV